MQTTHDTSAANRTPKTNGANGTRSHPAPGASTEGAQLNSPVTSQESASQAQPEPPALTIKEVLDKTRDWGELTDALERTIDPVFKYPLVLTSSMEGKKTELPVSIDAYSSTKYTVGTEPTCSTEGTTVHRNVSMSYLVQGKPKPFGKVSFLVTDSTGQVLEVGASSEKTLKVFRENVFGRDYTPEDLERLYTVNEKLISALRAEPTCAEKLADFVANREHEPEWADDAKLAYYNPRSFDILRWARQNDIAFEDLYHAGFVDRTVTDEKVSYRAKSEPVIFIPFSDDNGRIVLWRMRVINPEEGKPKYRSAPLERADRFPPSVHRELYQAHLLKDVRGKPLIITEGEFKCMVATQLTGIATVGITGITQVTDLIIKKIIEAGPSQVIVLLDRDPQGKGDYRTDSLTDSERAAFLIAQRLIRAGHPNVTVGTIPDRFNGDKCGIDDFLLDINKTEGKAAVKTQLEQIIKDSLEPQLWLAKRSNDPGLQEVLAREQRLRQVIRDFSGHLRRSGDYPPGSKELKDAEGSLQKAQEMLDSLSASKKRHLKENYGGARRITQPPMEYLTLFPTDEIHDHDRKCVVTQSGRILPLTKFDDHIISHRVIPTDLPHHRREPDSEAQGLPFDFSMAQLSSLFHHPKEDSRVAELYRRGSEILEAKDFRNSWNPKKMAHTEFVHRVLVGWLAQRYPPSEYRYEQDVRLTKVYPSHFEDIVTIPLAIFKQGYKPVAFCFLPHWDPSSVPLDKNLDADKRGVVRQDGINNLAALAAFEESQLRSAVRTALRNPKLEKQRKKLDQIFTCIRGTIGEPGTLKAREFLRTIGVSDSTANASGAIYVDKNLGSELVKSLGARKLINQAVQSGFLYIPEGERAEPRFTEDILLLPEIGTDGRCIGLNVLPISAEKPDVGSLPPVPKALFPLDSIRSTTKTFDRGRSFFPASEFRSMQGKTVLVASSELECLQLRSLVEQAELPDTVVIGLRELDSISRTEYERLAKSGAKKIIFVGQVAEENTLAIRYASIALRDPSTLASTSLQANPQQAPPVSAVSLRDQLSNVLVELGKDPAAAQRFLAELVNEPAFSPHSQTLAKLHFSVLLADLECAIALCGANQERPFEVDDALAALRGLYFSASGGERELEEFLSDRYQVPEEKAVAAFLEGFQRPIYRAGTPSRIQLKATVKDDLIRQRRSVRMLQERYSAPATGVLDGDLKKLRVPLAAITATGPASEVTTIQRAVAMMRDGDQLHRLSIHSSCQRVLSRNSHTTEISFHHGERSLVIQGSGSSKKLAEESAWLLLRKAILKVCEGDPSLRELYLRFENKLALRSRIQGALEGRSCFKALRREVNALKGHGIDISLSEGQQLKNSDGSWSYPITLTFEGESFEAVFEGPVPHLAKHFAAASLIVKLRDILAGKRLNAEFNEPQTMVQDLQYLAELLKVKIEKSATEEFGESGKSKVFSCRWSFSIAGEKTEAIGKGTSKTDAERQAALILLRALEKIDPVNRIREWE
jgi:hypothetical protein